MASIKTSKKQIIKNIMDQVVDLNPGLPDGAKILCNMVPVSYLNGKDVVKLNIEESDIEWEIMFIVSNKSKTIRIKDTKRRIKKMFDYSLI